MRILMAMRPLRQECARLMGLHVAGVADADDRHSYQMARVRLLMLQSVNRGIRHPAVARDVVADRNRLSFAALVGDGDPFPEPQPS